MKNICVVTLLWWNNLNLILLGFVAVFLHSALTIFSFLLLVALSSFLSKFWGWYFLLLVVCFLLCSYTLLLLSLTPELWLLLCLLSGIVSSLLSLYSTFVVDGDFLFISYSLIYGFAGIVCILVGFSFQGQELLEADSGDLSYLPPSSGLLGGDILRNTIYSLFFLGQVDF